MRCHFRTAATAFGTRATRGWVVYLKQRKKASKNKVTGHYYEGSNGFTLENNDSEIKVNIV
jgi:hypothetical protein